MLDEVLSERKSFEEPTPELRFKKFRIVLIKPSKYDDDGYVIRLERRAPEQHTQCPARSDRRGKKQWGIRCP
jgi:hypothetical protein